MTERRTLPYVLLIVLGAVFLFNNLGITLGWLSLRVMVPLGLIVLGLYLLTNEGSALPGSRSQQERPDGEDHGSRHERSGSSQGLSGLTIVLLIILGLVVFPTAGSLLAGILATVISVIAAVFAAVVSIVATAAVGIPLLALLLPLAIFVGPILLVLWIFSLLF